MTSSEMYQELKSIVENIDQENFIYDILSIYGSPKATITRLKKGDFNLAKDKEAVLYKRKVFFKQEASEELLIKLEDYSKDNSLLRHQIRFIILTDYEQLVAKDIKTGKNLDISIHDLANHYAFFLPLAGAEVYQSSNDNEADRNAAYKMAQLYDILVTENKELYQSAEKTHDLNIFLSRILFCYFAEDTGIFDEENIFTNTLVQHSLENGADTHVFLEQLFNRLNTKDKDLENVPVHLKAFPYVNGDLFRHKISIPLFTNKARKVLIALGELNWQNINPDIFGSMIQAVVNPDYRENLGMHYTSVPNILKLIKPLFLDELYEEFEQCKTEAQYRQLIDRISKIKFFDPACGSGNFLIITYKEIRRLEIEILKKIIDLSGEMLFVFSSIHLSQFYGIEIDDFAQEVAVLSLWLAEHQMNQYFESQLEGYTEHQSIIPLKKSGTIVQGNAARLDWESVCSINTDEEVYIIGNPPFLGSRNQNTAQKDDMKFVFQKGYKSMDYVSIWFYKGAKLIENKKAQLALVSTNSICQGLLVGLTWPRILNKQIEISFAYQSFKWVNNAKHNAGVTVIIVGLRNKSNKPKYIFTENIKKEAKNINTYLLDGSNIYIQSKNQSISNFPTMNFGNMPADGGYLLFSEQEKNEFISKEPNSKFWFKELISAHEFLNGKKRYCLWLEDISESELNSMPLIKGRVDAVYKIRLKSSRPQLAEVPHLFAQITQPPNSDFIFIPRHSSESRKYIPIGYFNENHKAHDSALIIGSSNTPWLFGIIHSRIHTVWVDAVGGKLETRYRYSAKLCYNTFPFPEISDKQKELLNQYVFDILDERGKHVGKTMAQLYDPDTMPEGLRKAHEALDLAVEKCYRLQPFNSDTERLEYLFKLYEEMTKEETLFTKEKKKGRRKKAIT